MVMAMFEYVLFECSFSIGWFWMCGLKSMALQLVRFVGSPRVFIYCVLSYVRQAFFLHLVEMSCHSVHKLDVYRVHAAGADLA